MSSLTVQQAFDLGREKQLSGDLPAAESIYRQILGHDPSFAQAYHMLGVLAMQVGRMDVAVELFRQAISINPTFAETYCELGNIFGSTGQSTQAVGFYRAALRLRPDYPECLNNFANALQDQGKIAEAIDAIRKALALQPAWPQLHSTLGNLLKDSGRRVEAVQCYRRALQLKPDFCDAINNLANILQEHGQLDEAIELFGQVLAIQPDLPEAHYNLGNALRETGQISRAIASFDRSLALRPDPITHSNRIYAMHFDPAFDAPAIGAELARWNQLHALPLAGGATRHANDRNPDRRLRIGYVSPDFKEHVVGWNLLPLLSHHDHRQFEVVCYSSVQHPDGMTEKLKAHADVWRNIFGMDDHHAAETIRADGIDILVDLSLHSAHHRLLTFARKPAPLQISYLGYCGSTGLTAIDYRFSDPFLDPADGAQPYAEKTLHLPHTYWCYQPGMATPEPGPLPALTNGFITLGSLNNFAKISDPALRLWADILLALPKSRLILHAPAGQPRQRVLAQFTERGVQADRIEFIGKQPFDDYMRNYHRIDIALDPFPYNGGITTCDALWMGVPVITLEGKTAVGRAGKSILSNVGLRKLVSSTPERYQQIILEVAADLPRLAKLRAALRDRMKASALMNPAAFAKDVEAAYRKIWREFAS